MFTNKYDDKYETSNAARLLTISSLHQNERSIKWVVGISTNDEPYS